jgi:hypothetical protein
MFVAGGFIASDYYILFDTTGPSSSLVTALLGTIFAGGIYFFEGLKGLKY